MGWIHKLFCLCEHDYSDIANKGQIISTEVDKIFYNFPTGEVIGFYEIQKCTKCKKIRETRTR